MHAIDLWCHVLCGAVYILQYLLDIYRNLLITTNWVCMPIWVAWHGDLLDVYAHHASVVCRFIQLTVPIRVRHGLPIHVCRRVFLVTIYGVSLHAMHHYAVPA